MSGPDEFPGFRRGDVVVFRSLANPDRTEPARDVRSIVLRVGRGMVRALAVKREDGPVVLVTEADYWRDEGRLVVVSRKAANRRWAAEFLAAHGDRVPLV